MYLQTEVSEMDLLRMENNRNHMAERILTLTIKIISLLTGEEYIVVRKMGEEGDGWSRGPGPITSSPPHSLIHKEILELISKLTELLTGEVSIRCQDVAVYFSMDEW
ncbi:gastrula zinc finger protein XlCGF53.1-like [Bufo bufo]|uniref:gastrula zinc finger protein XlCGF53.1-like n=1 Tax=Bufo bufo TaxID=8384 RepID=UPI001ABE7627|nr:gastrula zinc finger protein XlCGF53.1-like [Bufo bufo]